MTSEQLQFLISQYADGTLDESELPIVEKELRVNPEARRLLEEYRQLDKLIREAMPVPEMDWEQLASQVSRAIDEQAQESIPISPFRWRPLALAAALMLGVGLSVLLWMGDRRPAGELYVSAFGEVSGITTEGIEVIVAGVGQPPAAGAIQVTVGRGALPFFPIRLENYRDVTARPSAVILITATDLYPDDGRDYNDFVIY